MGCIYFPNVLWLSYLISVGFLTNQSEVWENEMRTVVKSLLAFHQTLQCDIQVGLSTLNHGMMAYAGAMFWIAVS